MVKLTKFHRRNIEKMLKKAGIESDLIDTKALWDSSLSAEENYNRIREEISKLKPVINAPAKDEIEYYENLAMEMEREYIQQQIEKGLEEIKKSTTPELDKYYWKLRKFIEIFLRGDICSFFLIGKPAIGKTYNTIRVLAENNAKFEYVVGNISPLEMVHLLYRNKDKNKIVIMDDTQSLLRNKTSMSILMSALWSATGVRMVEWRTTSKRLKVPNSFEFKGKIIFILNEIPNNTDMETLLSRCFSYELNFDYYTILKIMYEIAKIPHQKLSRDERIMIVDFIKENTTPATKDFNLRLQKKIETIYMFEKERWKELALEIIKPDEDLQLIKELMETYKMTKHQVREWTERTGKSRRTFFMKKRLLTENLVQKVQ